MTLCRISRFLIAFGFALAVFCFVGLNTMSAQGRGNGKGGGGGSGGGDTGGGQAGWIQHFSGTRNDLETSGWGIEQTGSPDSLFGIPGAGVAKSFERDHVDILNGILRLKLTLTNEFGTLTSRGALVYTKALYGYGAYEWCARMSSTAALPQDPGSLASGGVSAGFVYVNNSQTEIDFELARSGSEDWWLYMANWANRRLTSSAERAQPSPPNDFHSSFKIYKFVWTKDYVEFFVDDDSLAFHTANVPRATAQVLINHWGTNNPTGFGGPADTTLANRNRYFFVDWVRYTPPFEPPVGGPVACGPA